MKHLQEILKDLFNTSNDNSATILTTFLILGLTVFINELLKLISKSNERRRMRRLIRISIEEFLKSVKKQAHKFNETIDSLNFEAEVPFYYSRVDIPQTISINSIGYKNTYDSFLNNRRMLFKKQTFTIKCFNTLWEIVSSIDYWHNQALIDFQDYNKIYNQHNERRNEAIEKLRIYLESNLLLLKSNPQNFNSDQIKYLISVDVIFAGWQSQTKPQRPDVIQEHLIEKLQELNREDQDLKIAFEMNELLLKSAFEFDSMKSVLGHLAIIFKNNRHHFLLVSKKLTIIRKTL